MYLSRQTGANVAKLIARKARMRLAQDKSKETHRLMQKELLTTETTGK